MLPSWARIDVLKSHETRLRLLLYARSGLALLITSSRSQESRLLRESGRGARVIERPG
jgi:hypothetical protein